MSVPLTGVFSSADVKSTIEFVEGITLPDSKFSTFKNNSTFSNFYGKFKNGATSIAGINSFEQYRGYGEIPKSVILVPTFPYSDYNFHQNNSGAVFNCEINLYIDSVLEGTATSITTNGYGGTVSGDFIHTPDFDLCHAYVWESMNASTGIEGRAFVFVALDRITAYHNSDDIVLGVTLKLNGSNLFLNPPEAINSELTYYSTSLEDSGATYPTAKTPNTYVDIPYSQSGTTEQFFTL